MYTKYTVTDSVLLDQLSRASVLVEIKDPSGEVIAIMYQEKRQDKSSAGSVGPTTEERKEIEK